MRPCKHVDLLENSGAVTRRYGSPYPHRRRPCLSFGTGLWPTTAILSSAARANVSMRSTGCLLVQGTAPSGRSSLAPAAGEDRSLQPFGVQQCLRIGAVGNPVDEAIQHLLHHHYEGRHKDFLPILSLFHEASEEELVAAIRLLEDYGMVPTYETLRCVIMHQAVPVPETLLPPDRISMEEPNFSHYYDNLRGVL